MMIDASNESGDAEIGQTEMAPETDTELDIVVETTLRALVEKDSETTNSETTNEEAIEDYHSQAADSDSNEIEQDDTDDADAPSLPLVAQISALLFVSPRPMTIAQLSELTRAQETEIETAIGELRDSFTEDIHGFTLVETAEAFQYRTAAKLSKVVQRLIPARARKLSRAAAETLAVVAYKQPVQRADIESLRGVDALPTIKTLLEAKLIRIVGRAQTAGHPALYGTTQTFLEKFGMRDLSELPTSREMLELTDEPGEARDEESEEVLIEDQQLEVPPSSQENIEIN